MITVCSAPRNALRCHQRTSQSGVTTRNATVIAIIQIRSHHRHTHDRIQA